MSVHCEAVISQTDRYALALQPRRQGALCFIESSIDSTARQRSSPLASLELSSLLEWSNAARSGGSLCLRPYRPLSCPLPAAGLTSLVRPVSLREIRVFVQDLSETLR